MINKNLVGPRIIENNIIDGSKKIKIAKLHLKNMPTELINKMCKQWAIQCLVITFLG